MCAIITDSLERIYLIKSKNGPRQNYSLLSLNELFSSTLRQLFEDFHEVGKCE